MQNAKSFSEKCPIWGSPASKDHHDLQRDMMQFDSPKAGGTFSLDGFALKAIDASKSWDMRVCLADWIFYQNKLGIEYPEVTEDLISQLEQSALRDVPVRIERLIILLGEEQKRPDRSFDVSSINQGHKPDSDQAFRLYRIQAATSSANWEDFFALIELAISIGLLSRNTSSYYNVQLTFKGWEKFAALKTELGLNTQVFVAMWFSKSMDDIYADGFASAVADAGYEPIRIDRKEHNNKIDDEIVAEIRRSKFVIADFTSEVVDRQTMDGKIFKDTHARGGVYFEAGFAKGLGKEVIWTVREDVLPFVHFDTRQFAHIVWKDAADLRLQLSRRISATMGDGPNKKPT